MELTERQRSDRGVVPGDGDRAAEGQRGAEIPELHTVSGADGKHGFSVVLPEGESSDGVRRPGVEGAEASPGDRIPELQDTATAFGGEHRLGIDLP
jgi:hypothetical protein